MFRSNPGFAGELGSTAKSLLLPALAAAAGTGALTGYTASKENRPDENPHERRRRILRNAMLGSAMGGGATMALPLAYKTLTTPFTQDRPSLPGRAVNGVGDKLFSNILPAAAGGAGGMAWLKHVQTSKGKAGDSMFNLMSELEQAPANKDIMRRMLSSPDGRKSVLAGLSKKPDLAGSRFAGNELMQEAGFPGVSVADMAKGTGGRRLPGQYQEWLGQQGPLSKLISKAGPEAAETYGRFARPSAARAVGRMNPLLAAGLIGGGMLTAKELQNKLVGN